MTNPCLTCKDKDNFNSCIKNYSNCPMYGTWIVMHLLNRVTLLQGELDEIRAKSASADSPNMANDSNVRVSTNTWSSER